jgi:phosphoribosyl 1,2-cyclic phosphodiesterase
MRTLCPGEDFYIGDVNVNPFSIPHDAMDPVGYALSCKGLRCAVATDIGHISRGWMDAVSGCQALVLEANHDVEMVGKGPYPSHLKKRILGRRGHLNNEDCAKALLSLVKTGTQAVFLSHLSQDNNLPELAYNTVCGALYEAGYDVGTDIRVSVSRRDKVSDMLVLESEDVRAM